MEVNMKFDIPSQYFKNDTAYHHYGSDYRANIFGCGFLNKKSSSCTETNTIFQHFAVVLILNGKGVHVDNEGNKTKIFPGCMIQRIPDMVQSLYINPDSNWLEFFICISKDLHRALIPMNMLDSNQNVLYPGVSKAIFSRFIKFHDSMKRVTQTELNLLIPEALRLILTLYEMHKENSGNSNDREIVRQACLLLSQLHTARNTPKEIASSLGVGYEKFRKLFKNQIGMSPGYYVIQRRMDHAKTLLIETNKDIKEIAIELGFPDTCSFSKQFKHMEGVSPSEFRDIY